MRRKRTIFFLTVGVLCIVTALSLTAYNIWDEQRAEVTVAESVTLVEKNIQVQPEEQQLIVPEAQPFMSSVQVDGYNYVGVLEIPAMELKLPVLEEWSESLLRVAPCLYEGNLYDGMIIAGHNYRSHFGGLGRLGIGDDICFTDVDGTRWNYTVTTTEVIPGSDVEAMTSGGWDLTLFTCTYGGQERYTVRATLTNHG